MSIHPSQVVQLHPEDNCVTVDTLGCSGASAACCSKSLSGWAIYVLLHIGFVMSKIDEEEAQASLEASARWWPWIPKQDILPC